MTEFRRHRVILLPGDGIGPEVTGAARRVLDASGACLDWEVREVGAHALSAEGDPLPTGVVGALRTASCALKGPVTTPAGSGFGSVNVRLRRELDLFCQVRRCRTFPGVASRFAPVDLAILRETTEDLYAGVELAPGSAGAEAAIALLGSAGHGVPSGAGLSIKYTSEAAVCRMVRFALEWARRNGRRKVTVVHKSTVMRATDGLFVAVARDVAASYPDIEVDDALVDNVAAQLVRAPERFDVLVTSNLYGDVLSDLAAGLVGGVGLVAGGNFGDGPALFEPGHGSAPRHACRNAANPVATILSGAMMLHHLGESTAGRRVEEAVARVLSDGRRVTYDVAAPGRRAVGTSTVADAVIDTMR